MPQILLSSKLLAAMVQNEVSFKQTELLRLFKTSKERIERQENPMEEGLKPMVIQKLSCECDGRR
jgi:hypothetical protein